MYYVLPCIGDTNHCIDVPKCTFQKLIGQDTRGVIKPK